MASLYVGNLDPECTEAVLYQKFSPIGNLLNIRLCKDKTGCCLGYGFVNFASKTSAQIAMITLNYTLLKNRMIRLMWVDKNIKKMPPDANIFIRNLHYNIDEKSLYDIFANYGTILSLKLARTENGTSKGYGFIQFADEKSAEKAIEEIHDKIIFGKIVYVSKFIPQKKRLAMSVLQFQNIYIKNFDSGVKDDDLYEMCKEYGEISSAKVMKDEEGNSRCFGFVSFKNPENAKEAVRELNGKMFNGRKLFANRAMKKADRQKEIMENFKRSLQTVQNNGIQSV